jgi:hypothetical protein
VAKTMFLCLALCAGFSLRSTDAPAAMTNFCQVKPLRADALDFPSKHAWDLFLTLNHPAVPKDVARGLPDCSKPIGTPGTTAVWETWRNAHTEVFLPDGSEPPHWNDTSLPEAAPGTVPEAITVAGGDQKSKFSFHDIASTTVRPSFSPEDGTLDSAFKGKADIE